MIRAARKGIAFPHIGRQAAKKKLRFALVFVFDVEAFAGQPLQLIALKTVSYPLTTDEDRAVDRGGVADHEEADVLEIFVRDGADVSGSYVLDAIEEK